VFKSRNLEKYKKTSTIQTFAKFSLILLLLHSKYVKNAIFIYDLKQENKKNLD